MTMNDLISDLCIDDDDIKTVRLQAVEDGDLHLEAVCTLALDGTLDDGPEPEPGTAVWEIIDQGLTPTDALRIVREHIAKAMQARS